MSGLFTTGQSLVETARRLPFTLSFWLIGGIYGLSMIYWIWILTWIPLTIAYPFSTLPLLIVPIFAFLLFREPLSVRYWVGVLLVVIGIWTIVS